MAPIRDSIHKSTATSIEYYIPKYCLSFLKDILFICEKNNITFCLKSKVNFRKITIHPSYKKFIDSISKKSNVLIIPEETSPYDLIKKTDISVAMPFTSTPLISQILKKPSCYYDSSGFIEKNNISAQGTEIIIGVSELDNWILKQMNF